MLLESDPALRASKIHRKEPEVVATGKARKLVDRRIKKEDDDNAEVDAWWPPFEFNGRNALERTLNLNLKNCQYELFRKIAVNELGWRVLDRHGKILEPPAPLAKQPFPVIARDSNERTEDPESTKIVWDIYWADGGISPENVAAMGPCQRMNHYLGMYNICRKSTLGMHLKRF